MTKVITRYFDSADDARSIRDELMYEGKFSSNIMRIFENQPNLTDVLTAADVAPTTAQAYATQLAKGGAVLMVRAGFKPLGVARITREAFEARDAKELGGVVEEITIKDDYSKRQPSVMGDHPLMLTRLRNPKSTTFYMANWPFPLISRRKPYTGSLIPRHGRMADLFLPLLSKREPYTGSIFGRHARMANFPIGLISRRKPITASIFSRHARMANFPIPLLSQRKPYTGSLIARHARMANWPFPHLINGKPGTNSLIPGAPRMANFPISLLSGRKPYDESMFPRHARMANFPLPLTNRRKPFTGSIFPRHARMAAFPFPLVIKTTDEMFQQGATGSFSKYVGWPTVIRR